MTVVKTGKVDAEDLSIVLASDLVDAYGDFYNLTLGMAIEEETRGDPFEYVEYVIDSTKKELINFIGWTRTKVVVNLNGMGVRETLLTSYLRNPPDAKNLVHIR